MIHNHPSLGLCFFGNQLFYAINNPDDPKKLARIGSFDFNIDVSKTLLGYTDQHLEGIKQTVQEVKEQYGVQHLRILSYPTQECWTTVPKVAYDNADEREKHISILMQGVDRNKVHPTWYNLSNQDYKFLLLRNDLQLEAMRKLAAQIPTSELVSDFEVGAKWVEHSNPGGSFMNICCYPDCISVSSFILGKLRGATYITFDDPEDLPYLWLQHGQQLSWMTGIHENIYLYGMNVYRILDILQPFLDDAGTIVKMDTLEKISVKANEETYGFNLEEAFPAILLALD